LRFVESCGILANRKEISFSVAVKTVGGCPLVMEGNFLPLQSKRKEGALMNLTEFFDFCLVVIGVCDLFIQIRNNKNNKK